MFLRQDAGRCFRKVVLAAFLTLGIIFGKSFEETVFPEVVPIRTVVFKAGGPNLAMRASLVSEAPLPHGGRKFGGSGLFAHAEVSLAYMDGLVACRAERARNFERLRTGRVLISEDTVGGGKLSSEQGDATGAADRTGAISAGEGNCLAA